MTGLIKQKEYDWKDSNLALFGSDTERQVKKESAECEPMWKNAGQKVGLQIWRIVKFKVERWPKEDEGKFYDGDSYIILNTYQEEGTEELLYDVHFWIGQYSTQDEYGTAAYKTVELDTYLDDKPVQHREVQDFESDLFKTYFKAITIMHGGADSGFRHVKPTEYKPKLLHFHGDRKGVLVKEIPIRSELDSTDVYIMDLGMNLIQWNGSGSNKDERHKAMQYILTMRDERGGKPRNETLDEGHVEADHPFNTTRDNAEEQTFGTSKKSFVAASREKELYRLSDASGEMQMTLERSGRITIANFDTNDVFIFDTKITCYVWIGDQTSSAEKKNAMSHAHNYLMKTDHPLVPIACFKERQTSVDFKLAIAA